ncbi:MAG: NAD kinase [Bacteroidales bacterium]|nr:NAD kinase [Bacteroidales bacterium]MBN2819399.1 NAD kinase [Bacteroidales bacterium]
MKIAIFGKSISQEFHIHIVELIDRLKSEKVEISIYLPFFNIIKSVCSLNEVDCSFFSTPFECPDDINFLVTIGGDGTFLESILFLKSSDIPAIGINTGRLGYLATIARDEISKAFDAIFSNNYKLEERSLLRVETDIDLFDGYNFALNEVTIQKIDSSLLSIDTWINGEFLNTFWTDGLIIATPTGSTAYSLSVGGPIVMPGSCNFTIAPIASHNLSVRPIVVHDNVVIEAQVKSRNDKYLLTADNRTHILNVSERKLTIRKTKFILKLLILPYNSYFNTLRNKLMWGMDKRN